MHLPCFQAINIRIPMHQVPHQFLIELEAGIPSDRIIDVFDMLFEIFLELRGFRLMVTEKVGVHFNPIIPVQFANSHGDRIWAMTKWAIQFWWHRIGLSGLRLRKGSNKRLF